MSWLEHVRRRDDDRNESTNVLVDTSSDVATAESGFIKPNAFDYRDFVEARPSWLKRWLAFIFRPWPSLVFFVIIPSAAVIFYFAFIAADQYVVQSRFVVRQVEHTSSAKGTIKLDSTTRAGANAENNAGETDTTTTGSQQTAITTDDQDAYVVASYIGSSTIIDNVSKDLNLVALFRRPEADFWTRLKQHASQEDFRRYWLDMVDAYVDRPTGIVTLAVRAFRREDALMLSNAILTSASRLVNDMSYRAREDALARARQEVERADKSLQVVMADLETFRNREGLIDPINVATNTGDLLKRLLTQRIATDTELYVTRSMRPDAPTIPTLEERLKALDVRIGELRSSLTANGTPDSRTISATLVGYDELELKEQVAKEMYIAARSAEENARESAERRWLYLATFDPPTLPDDSEYPRRVGFSAIAIVVLFALWSIAALIWASVLDHRS